MRQRRVAGAELVHREAHTQFAQAAHRLAHAFHALQQQGLGDLERQLGRVQPVDQEHRGHLGHEARARQVGARDVDVQPRARSARRHAALQHAQLRAGTGQNPVGEPVHQHGLRGHGDEGVGRHQTALRVLPSDQRLETVGAAAGQIVDGLEHEAELFRRTPRRLPGCVARHRLQRLLQRLLQCPAQVALQVRVRSWRGLRTGVEDGGAAAAGRLGAGQGDVGVAQHIAGRVVADAAEGDADARAAADLGAVECMRRGQRAVQALGHGQQHPGVAEIVDEDRELVRTQPAHGVARARLRTDALRHQRQESITRIGAQRVVDELEAVEFQVHHRELVPGLAPAAHDGLRQAVTEADAVGQRFQRGPGWGVRCRRLGRGVVSALAGGVAGGMAGGRQPGLSQAKLFVQHQPGQRKHARQHPHGGQPEGQVERRGGQCGAGAGPCRGRGRVRRGHGRPARGVRAIRGGRHAQCSHHGTRGSWVSADSGST